MIITKEPQMTDAQLAEVRSIVESFGCHIQVIVGAHRCVYAILGDETHELMFSRLQGLDYVDRVDRIESPYKLMDVRSQMARHEIEIGGVTLGKELLFIAGPCTVDPNNPNLLYETAAAVKEAGAQVLRAGVWKPRTQPYSFQGDNRSLDLILEARARTGLPVNIEVMDEEQLNLAVSAGVDMVQVGTRNALNYSLLKAIGRATNGKGTVVLLKRGRHMGPIDEFIAAAEYIATAGNPNILLCPRGTMPTLEGYRSHPDESITPLLKSKTWAPVVVDPSHSVGRATYVPPCALASIAYGVDGLCIEAHIAPAKGLGDDPKQSVTPEALRKLIQQSRDIRALLRA
jgi:3-deoxy-7-phosphoheptulonate synthase